MRHVIVHNVVSVDGFIADEITSPIRCTWYFSGDAAAMMIRASLPGAVGQA